MKTETSERQSVEALEIGKEIEIRRRSRSRSKPRSTSLVRKGRCRMASHTR